MSKSDKKSMDAFMAAWEQGYSDYIFTDKVGECIESLRFAILSAASKPNGWIQGWSYAQGKNINDLKHKIDKQG